MQSYSREIINSRSAADSTVERKRLCLVHLAIKYDWSIALEEKKKKNDNHLIMPLLIAYYCQYEMTFSIIIASRLQLCFSAVVIMKIKLTKAPLLLHSCN